MPTFDEVRDAVLPGARVVVPAGADSAPISWVRVMKARVPAFDALDRGDLAIVPATALPLVASGGREAEALVEACAQAHVGGLILVDADDAADGGLALVEQAAVTLCVPTLRTGRSDPSALERSVIGYLVNARAELDRQAAALEARLEGLALEGVGSPGLVAGIADFLGRSVALEGRRAEPLAVHAPAGVVDAAAAVAAYHVQPRTAAYRVALPAAGGTTATLALLGDRPPSDLERVAMDRIAPLLALELTRDEAVRRARDNARRSEALPAEGPPWAVLVARQRSRDAADTPESREAARRDIRLLAPAARMALRGDADSLELRAVLAATPDDPLGLRLADVVASSLGRTVALSRPFTTPGDRPAAEADARATLEASELLDEPPRVARADRLPAYRLLGNLHNVPDGARLGRALLEPLLAGRPDVRREHLETLRAVLDHPGLAEAAADLGVHRNTVAYRIRRMEALTGWTLSDPELRLPLSLALRLVQRGQV